MINFITIVLAIVAAQIITFAVGCALLTNDKFTTWYMRKSMKIAEKVQDEMLDDWFDKED